MKTKGFASRFAVSGLAILLAAGIAASQDGTNPGLVEGSAESFNAGGDIDSAAKQLQATEAELLRQFGEAQAQPDAGQAVPSDAGTVPVAADAEAVPFADDLADPLAAQPEAVPAEAAPALPSPEDLGIPVSAQDSARSKPAPRRDLQQQVKAMEQVRQPVGVPAPSGDTDARVADLQKRLSRAQAKINGLMGELDKARNRLMLSETEVERLSAVIDERYRARYATYAPAKRRFDEDYVSLNGLPASLEGKVTEDMPIATVVVEKAHLRTGPGLNNSPLMTISRGTRLAIETRRGDWYRVISPTGARAWIASNVIGFAVGRGPDPASSTRVKGFDPRLDKRASDGSSSN